MMAPLWRNMLSGALMLTLAIACAIGAILVYFTQDLPDYSVLEEYNPPVVTRLYAADGRVLQEYAHERRIFVPIDAMPKMLINAFLAAEDRQFYSHPGVNIMSIIRASAQNFLNAGNDRSMIGGSTITQQVVKNFLLNKDRTYTRKIKEAILAYRITKAYSKDRILELYLNEIYLGGRSYGVAAAALHYFNKSLDQLNVEEMALLAALPKAPSAFDPRRNYERAEQRRNWVIRSMAEEGFVSREEAERAMAQPIIMRTRDSEQTADASFFAEEVRRELLKTYGEKQLYGGGLAVYTTVDPDVQTMARDALKNGLREYDRRHGYRGALKNIDGVDNWMKAVREIELPAMVDSDWQLAVVLKIKKDEATIGLVNGERNVIKLEESRWARKWIQGQFLAGEVQSMVDVVRRGDVILVSRKDDHYLLEQVPELGGAIVVMDPYSGKVIALQGGYNFEKSQFNRATQAHRQPGSAFKPFAYLAALEKGYTPATLVNDEPLELYWGTGDNLQIWKPANYSEDFLGPTTLRRGLELSRNVMTVRLAVDIGIEKIVEIAKRFGISDNPVRNFSTALGANETTVLRLVNAYAALVNSGKRVEPHFVERIQDRNGKTVWRRDTRDCVACRLGTRESTEAAEFPHVVDNTSSVTDPYSAYQIVHMLEGVVQRGTARKASELGIPLAGKTGTTNNANDAWFIGFSSEIVVGVFMGFDTPRSLGEKETGSSVALPVFIDFMKSYYKDRKPAPFAIPSGIEMVRIDYQTGYLPTSDTPKNEIVVEAFKPGTAPTQSVEYQQIFDPFTEGMPIESPTPLGDDMEDYNIPQEGPTSMGTGGIY